jgi:Protein of unknown function (DUF4240)
MDNSTVFHINMESLDDTFVQSMKNQFGPAELEIHITKKPKDWLNEDLFWETIALFDWEKQGNDEAVIEPVVQSLSAMPIGNIHQFQDILSEKLWRLDTQKHANASLNEDRNASLSVDYFLYDRCCVVANGKDFYEKVLQDPSQMPVGLSFGRLLSVASNAYHRKTGKTFAHIPLYNYETYSNEAAWPE